MLAEERYRRILQLLDQRNTVTVSELTGLLDSSEATIRRDLTTLEKEKKLSKVHGGAVSLKNRYVIEENDVTERYSVQSEEKDRIGRYAASLIEEHDFVYLDAGTTTEAVIDHVKAKNVVFITNGLPAAQHLVNRGFKVFLLGGKLKALTGAVIGGEAIDSLNKYHFTIGFFGTNGIDPESGYTTPDVEEARTKREAVNRCAKAYVLADSSKFDKLSSVSFAALSQADIITTALSDSIYKELTGVREVE